MLQRALCKGGRSQLGGGWCCDGRSLWALAVVLGYPSRSPWWFPPAAWLFRRSRWQNHATWFKCFEHPVQPTLVSFEYLWKLIWSTIFDSWPHIYASMLQLRNTGSTPDGYVNPDMAETEIDAVTPPLDVDLMTPTPPDNQLGMDSYDNHVSKLNLL